MKKDITYGYFTPEFDKQLAEEVAPIKRDAKKDGAHYAKQAKSRPPLNESSMLPYIGGYKARFEAILIKKLDEIKPEVQTEKYNRFKEQKTKRDSEIDTEVAGGEHENRVDERTLDGKPKPKAQKRNIWPIIFLIILYLGEFYYNSLAFAFLGGSMIGAYLIGATVTLAVGILAFVAGKILCRADEIGRSAYIKAAPYILIALAVVIAMSVLRANVQSAGDMHTPAWVFFLVNIGYLVSTIALSRIAFAPSKEQAVDCATSAIYKRIEERTAKIKLLRDEKLALEKALEQEEEEYQFVISKARRVEEMLNAHFREAVEGFKTENLITRSDLGTPVCFLQPVPPLQTKKSE